MNAHDSARCGIDHGSGDGGGLMPPQWCPDCGGLWPPTVSTPCAAHTLPIEEEKQSEGERRSHMVESGHDTSDSPEPYLAVRLDGESDRLGERLP